MTLFLFCPKPVRAAQPVYPVFLPFMGCPTRCVFCSQHAQSGTGARPLAQTLATVAADVRARAAAGRTAVELAFFGGTFTALPPQALEQCLRLGRELQEEGCVATLRCSTKPDAVDAATLAALRDAGFSTVELGVQSFDDAALLCSRRGYDGAVAARACALVRGAGLTLGVQLMPGMPGVTPRVFTADVRRALDAGARCLRYYPCLVLHGTGLAAQWVAGAFRPWSLEQTLPALARAWNAAQAAGATVIRMGLAPQDGLDAQILAGPRHPALGTAVQGLALYYQVRNALRGAFAGGVVQAVRVPRHRQGAWWGHGGSLAARWARLGITRRNTHWTDGEYIEIDFSADARP